MAETFPSFDFGILIELPEESTGSGVFIFVSMLTWGIWEEFIFRGVILTMLLKKYAISKAIIINGIIFGLYHCFNLLGGADPVMIIIQIISSMLGGFLYAYMFFRAENLIPSMVCHYLHNVLFSIIEQWFSNVLIPQSILVALVTRFFGGLISVIIGIFILKIGFQEKKSQTIILDKSD